MQEKSITHQYQDFTATTAVYPEADTSSRMEIAYLTLGLTGEAGEVANLAKKFIRDDKFYREKMIDELGDVAWYMARLSSALGVDMESLFQENQVKLSARKVAGTLKGHNRQDS
jgi:NTP pyrophosphatase (non-canonical NTP hydrolase)